MADKVCVKKDVCSICIEVFKNPKILTCFHSFCCGCLETYVEKFQQDDKFPCPMCRSEICILQGGVEKFTNNFYISDQRKDNSTDLDSSIYKLCELCQNNKSTQKCLDCEKILCSNCTLCHDFIVSDKNHTVVDISAAENIGFTQEKTADGCDNFCQVHKLNQNLFCEDCSQCICPMCFIKNHQGHKHLDLTLEKHHVSTKQEIESMKEKIISQLSDFSRASDSFDLKMSDLSAMASSVLVQIDAQSLKICNTVKQSATEIKEKVNYWLQEEIKRLEQEKREINIRKHIAEVQSIKLNNALLKESSVEIWPHLVTLRQEVSAFAEKPLVSLLPVVRISKFTEGQIIVSNLQEQIGCFDVQELPKPLIEGQTYDFTTSFYIKTVSDGSRTFVTADQVEIPWWIGCIYNGEQNVKYAHCYITLVNKDYEDIKSIDALVTFKLLNLLDGTKTIEKKLHRIPVNLRTQKGDGVEVIDQKTLEDETNGFLDSKYNFKIQTRVKIIKIVKRSNTPVPLGDTTIRSR